MHNIAVVLYSNYQNLTHTNIYQKASNISESEMQAPPVLNLAHFDRVDQILTTSTQSNIPIQIPPSQHLLQPQLVAMQQLNPTRQLPMQQLAPKQPLVPCSIIHTQLPTPLQHLSSTQLVQSTPVLTTSHVVSTNQILEFTHPPAVTPATSTSGPSLTLTNGIMSVSSTSRTDGSLNDSEFRVSSNLEF